MQRGHRNRGIGTQGKSPRACDHKFHKQQRRGCRGGFPAGGKPLRRSGEGVQGVCKGHTASGRDTLEQQFPQWGPQSRPKPFSRSGLSPHLLLALGSNYRLIRSRKRQREARAPISRLPSLAISSDAGHGRLHSAGRRAAGLASCGYSFLGFCRHLLEKRACDFKEVANDTI